MPTTVFRGELPVDIRSLLVATDRISSIFALAHAAAGSKVGTISAQVTRSKLQSTVTAGTIYQVASVGVFVPSDSLQSDITQDLAAFLLAAVASSVQVVVLAALADDRHQGQTHEGLRLLSTSQGSLGVEAAPLEVGNVVSSLAAATLIEAELKSLPAVCVVGLTNGQYITEENASVWRPLEAKLGLRAAELGLGVQQVEASVYSNHLYL
jgi:hypothetical protein